MRWVVWAVLVAAAGGCSANVRPDLTPVAPGRLAGAEMIGEVKAFAETLGGERTQNFLRHSDSHAADNRCYFTGRLQLPEFYNSLRMVREDQAQCEARAVEFDIFFYPVQAVASGEEAITVSLAEAPTERVLVVVPHEDFHSQPEARKAPTEAAEAAATLVGFLTAREFAKARFGAESPAFRTLERDVDLFLQKSLVVNWYYDKVRGLYEAFRAGEVTEAQALDGKAGLFRELEQACLAIRPDPVSFNKCPAALNNAGLAFDRTYTQNYPLVHDLYRLLDGDTARLVTTLRRLLGRWPSSASAASELIEGEP